MNRSFGGGHTSGGGAGRAHPADDTLRAVVRRYRKRYKQAAREVEKVLKRHFGGGHTSGGGAGRLRVGYKTKHTFALEKLTSGARWLAARAVIAAILYEANKYAVETINDAMPETFSEGANQTAWRLKQQQEYYPLPYTQMIVRDLARDHLITLPRRTVDEDKDKAWTEKRLQAIVTAYDLRDAAPDELPARIAQKLVRRCQEAMNTTAQAVIYGIFDMGMYQAGRDAKAAGLDVEKTWLSILDNRVRDSHRHLHGKTLPMSGLFHGLHGVLRFPHDPSAPPAETYNCRCRMAVHLKGHAPQTSARPLSHSEVAAYRRWRDETIDRLGTELEKEHRRRLNAL